MKEQGGAGAASGKRTGMAAARRRAASPDALSLPAAVRAVKKRVKQVSAILLAGSAARGPLPPDGDVDLVVFACGNSERSRRMVVREGSMLLELFIIAEADYPAMVQAARKSGLPSLLRMCKDSRIAAGGARAAAFIQTAERAYAAGPEPVTYAELDRRRWELTELLDDFRHAGRPEALFVAGRLLEKTAEFLLRAEDRWLGVGKWAHRTLEEFAPQAARELTGAAERFYRHDERSPLVRFVGQALAPYGGPLREGWLEEAVLPATNGDKPAEG